MAVMKSLVEICIAIREGVGRQTIQGEKMSKLATCPIVVGALSIIGCSMGSSPAEMAAENAIYTARVRVMPMRDRGEARSAISGASTLPAGTHLFYQGGKVIQSVRVVQVLYGSG